MKMLTIIILAVAAIAGFPVNSAARVMSISFDDLIKRSEYIVIGQVVSVKGVEPTKVAKVHVTRVLKGSPTQELYYLASRTWTCDISSAEVGERALFFFGKYQFAVNPKSRPVPNGNGSVRISGDFEEPMGFREQVQAESRTPLLQIAHSGRGKMPLRRIDGLDFVTSWSDVLLPKEISTVAGPEPKYEFIRSANLEQIIKSIEKILSRQQR